MLSDRKGARQKIIRKRNCSPSPAHLRGSVISDLACASVFLRHPNGPALCRESEVTLALWRGQWSRASAESLSGHDQSLPVEEHRVLKLPVLVQG